MIDALLSVLSALRCKTYLSVAVRVKRGEYLWPESLHFITALLQSGAPDAVRCRTTQI